MEGDIQNMLMWVVLLMLLLNVMGERLPLLQTQDALLLLGHFFALLKVLHILCSSPCIASSFLGALMIY